MKVQVGQTKMADEMAASRKQYVTEWRQGDKKGTYKTKSLTQYHKDLHDIPTMDYVGTRCIYLDVQWMFGAFSEIIAITNKAKPKNNKPFPVELIVVKPVKAVKQ